MNLSTKESIIIGKKGAQKSLYSTSLWSCEKDLVGMTTNKDSVSASSLKQNGEDALGLYGNIAWAQKIGPMGLNLWFSYT